MFFCSFLATTNKHLLLLPRNTTHCVVPANTSHRFVFIPGNASRTHTKYNAGNTTVCVVRRINASYQIIRQSSKYDVLRRILRRITSYFTTYYVVFAVTSYNSKYDALRRTRKYDV